MFQWSRTFANTFSISNSISDLDKSFSINLRNFSAIYTKKEEAYCHFRGTNLSAYKSSYKRGYNAWTFNYLGLRHLQFSLPLLLLCWTTWHGYRNRA